MTAAATAATAASQELWPFGRALFQRAQEPNIPFGNPSLRFYVHAACLPLTRASVFTDFEETQNMSQLEVAETASIRYDLAYIRLIIFK